MFIHFFSRLARIGSAICIAALMLGQVFGAVQAAASDNIVEWAGAGHLPGNNICGDVNFPYRSPLNPIATQGLTLLARSYYQDLTAISVYYTTKSNAAADTDWIVVPGSWVANWWGCGGADMDIWSFSIPAQTKQVWYKFAYRDGTDYDWLRASGEGTLSDDDGGWTTASTTLTYSPPASVFVDGTFSAATPGWGYDHFAVIQDGVNAVATAGTVNIAAGTYVEQVLVVGKADLSLLGAGQGVTTIQSPVTLAELFAGHKPIIGVSTGGNITIRDLTIDGDLQGYDNYHFYGIYMRNTGGLIQDLTIVDVNSNIAEGRQNGYGIWVENPDLAARTITVDGCSISNYLKSGVVIARPGLNGVVSGNTLTGRGATDVINQFGIQYIYGSTGSASGNEITAHIDTRSNLDPNYYVAGGVMIYGADNVTVQDNEIYGNEVGVYVLEDTSFGYLGTDNAHITGNTLAGNAYGVYYQHRNDGSTPAGNAGSVVAFNRIVGNSIHGIQNDMIPGVSVLAENNWWGCNGGTTDVDCDSILGEVDADPWLVLSTTANPASVQPLGTSTITASLLTNSGGATPAGGVVPDGITAAFSETGAGAMSPATAETAGGTAQSTYTAPAAAATYSVCADVDNESICTSVSVPNVAPVAVNDTRSVVEEGSLNVAAPGVLGNDSDPNGNAITAVLQVGPTHAATFGLNANGSFNYTPTANFYGSDSFTYQAYDGALSSNTATVSITVTNVDDPPGAVDDTGTTAEDTPLVTGAASLLANDINQEPTIDTLIVTAVSNPSGGSVSIDATNVTFTPAANFYGTAGFDYTLSDGHSTDTGHVTVTVTAVDDPPVAVDDTASTAEDTPLVTGAATLLANDINQEPAIDTLSLTAVSNAANGSVALEAGNITFTPTANFHGTAGFDYTLSDGHSTDTGHVTVTVAAVDDLPVAVDDTGTTTEDTPLVTGAATLLANDTNLDPEDTLSLTAVSNAANGSVALEAGNITFTPTANFHGTAGFDYTLSDGHSTDTGHVTITVTAVNDAPEAEDDTGTTAEDTPLSGTVTATDVDSAVLTFSGSGVTAHGAVVIGTDGSFTYTPDGDYNGEDSFVFTVSDGQLEDTGTISINVTAVNDAPEAEDDTVSTAEDTTLSGTVTATDVDNAALTFSGSGITAHGAVVIGTDGSFTYTPDGDYNGEDSFEFTVSDGQLEDTGTISINVTAVNDAPEAVDIADVEWEARSAQNYLIPAFTDVDSDALTYSAKLDSGDPLPAWLSFDAGTRTFSGTAANSDAGTYLVRVTAADSEYEDSGTFTLTVIAVDFLIFMPLIHR